MNTNGALREAAEAVAWYGKQARHVAAEVIKPIRRTIRLSADDGGSPPIDLTAAASEDPRADVTVDLTQRDRS